MQLSFDFCLLEAKPEHLIGDKAYDSDQLDAQLREQGVDTDRCGGACRFIRFRVASKA